MGFGVKLCSEKTLDMPFLAYYGCSKLLKARAVIYWGTHTRFTVSVGIDTSLTKTRRTIEVPIVYAWTRELELVLYGKLYIIRIRASYTWQYVKRNILLRFYGIAHACANSGAQAVFSPPPQKKNGLGTRLTGSLVAEECRIDTRLSSHPVNDSVSTTYMCIRMCVCIYIMSRMINMQNPNLA